MAYPAKRSGAPSPEEALLGVGRSHLELAWLEHHEREEVFGLCGLDQVRLAGRENVGRVPAGEDDLDARVAEIVHGDQAGDERLDVLRRRPGKAEQCARAVEPREVVVDKERDAADDAKELERRKATPQPEIADVHGRIRFGNQLAVDDDVPGHAL